MARPREFDEQTVLDAARDEFWEHGVAATSISQLSAATGLSVGSLYKAFSSKGGLCARTLDRYLDDGLDAMGALLDSGDTAVDGIDAWLGALADMASNSDGPRGCYGVVCAVELAGDEPEIRDRLRRHDERLVGRLTDALRSAQAEGADVTGPLDDGRGSSTPRSTACRSKPARGSTATRPVEPSPSLAEPSSDGRVPTHHSPVC